MKSFDKTDMLPLVFTAFGHFRWTGLIKHDLTITHLHGWVIRSEYPEEQGNVGRKTFDIADPLTVSFYHMNGKTEWVESNLAVRYFDFLDIGEGGYASLKREFMEKTDACSSEISKLHVPPDHKVLDEGECIRSYSWDIGEFSVVLSLKNEDSDLPFRICLQVFPPKCAV